MDHASSGDAANETPESILGALRGVPALRGDVEEQQLNRLIERFPADRLRRAILPRLDDLSEADGGVILRILEAHLDPELADALALALTRQPNLPADRSWEALAILDASGRLDQYAELAERWDELNDSIDPELASDNLAEQLEEEPEGSWVALEGLGAIDPETRREIIASLAEAPAGRGLVAFLRLLSFAHDDSTRSASLEALFDPRRDDADHRQAWDEVAHDHFDPKVRDRARRRLAIGGATDEQIEASIASALDSTARPDPELVGSLVTAVDGSGRGSIVLASRDRGQWVVASFTCDVYRGVVEVKGQVGLEPSGVSSFFDDFADRKPAERVEDDLELAAALLATNWLLSGPETNPALRFWIERTVGPGFQPRPLVARFDPEDVASLSLAMLAEPSWMILDACPSWVDQSPMTFDLAEAVTLRGGDTPPDPRRDAGAFRYLFEHHLIERMDHYHRLLLWMASFWDAAGEDEMARSAVALAWQLADPQNAVPGHPFLVALTTISLAAAQSDLKRGVDPRGKAI